MNDKDLYDCLKDVNIDTNKIINNAKRHVILSVCQSVCHGFKCKEKMYELRGGDKNILNPNQYVKYKYSLFVQG